MSHYKHLSIEEREYLYLLKGQGLTLRKIARRLGRSPSTISRELRRSKRKGHAYIPLRAQNYDWKRPKNSRRKHILSCPAHKEAVRHLIGHCQWWPEEISNCLKLENKPLQLSCGAIYRGIQAGIFDANKRQASRNRHN